MSDNDLYSKNLDAAVRRSAGVALPLRPHRSSEAASREAALRLRRERARQRAEALGHEDESFSFCETEPELTEEEKREYAAFLEEPPEDRHPLSRRSGQTLYLSGSDSLGGAYTNKNTVADHAGRNNKEAVGALLRSAHRDVAHTDEKEGTERSGNKSTENVLHREFIARVFVFCLFLGLLALTYWPD